MTALVETQLSYEIKKSRTKEDFFSSRRLAYMTVSRTMMDGLLPSGIEITSYCDVVPASAKDYSIIERWLDLPGNCRITGISAGHRFAYDQYTLRIACDDFKEVPEGDIMPEVEAMYKSKEVDDRAVPYFVGWSF